MLTVRLRTRPEISFWFQVSAASCRRGICSVYRRQDAAATVTYLRTSPKLRQELADNLTFVTRPDQALVQPMKRITERLGIEPQ